MSFYHKLIESTETELHFPDEDRFFKLFALKCWKCGTKGSVHMRRFTDEGQNIFQLYCNCKNESPQFERSQDAVNYWKLMVGLTR